MGGMEIKIKIPFKTPSVNHLYGHYHGRMYLRPDAKKLRQEIIQLCDKSQAMSLVSTKLKVTVEIYENWHTKSTGVRRVDISNREKFLIDSVFEGLGLDDKWIFEQKLIKREDLENEYSIIQIEELQA